MKVLVFTIRAGLGHIKAGEAIVEGINTLNGNSAKLFILLEDTILGWFINASYLWMARHSPYLWSLLYKKRVFYKNIWYIEQRIKNEVEMILEKETPDCILSTHPFITSAISKIKNRKLRLISVATDFDCHPIGIKDNVSLFIVPHKTSFETLVNFGIAPSKIRIIGIPISLKFSKNGKIKKKDLGFNEKPIILEIGGGYGLGHMERFIPILAKDRDLFQVIVITGKDFRLKKRMENSFKKYRIDGKVFGFVNNVWDFMEISDIMIGKPGGVGVMEASSKGLPIIIKGVIPGQEEANARVLINEGVAVMPKYNEIPMVLKDLLKDEEKRKKMKERALKFSKPYASLEIAREIVKIEKEEQMK